MDSVKSFLKDHHVGVLSTSSTNGEPWGATIGFAHDDDLNFYFLTRANTLKFKNIEENPQAALTITDEEKQITVQTRGTISRVETSDYTEIVFKKLMETGPKASQWVPPVVKVHEGDYRVLMLTPTKLQYADYRQVISDPNASHIQQII